VLGTIPMLGVTDAKGVVEAEPYPFVK